MSDRRLLLVALALAAVTVAVYAPALDGAFVNYDDDLYITERPEVRAGLTREGVAWAFTSVQGANWFPLTRLSWMLDAELFGVDPGAFHATSLVLHVASALLLLLAFLRLTGDLWPSAFVAGVFALHPLHVESVAWASARKDVVSGLFLMLALLAHERRARRGGSRVWGALLFAVLALGLMAKPVLVTLPCVVMLLDEWPLRRLRAVPNGGLDAARVRAALLEKLPLFALAAFASGATLVAQRAGGALQALERYPLGVRVENALDAYAVYVAKALWPAGLAVFYPHGHGGLPGWRVALAALLLIGVSAWVLRQLRGRPYLAVGWFWFLGTLVPMSGLVQVGQAARADRYTYIPLIGLSIMVAWGARELCERRPAFTAAVRRSGVLALVLLAGTAFVQVGKWRDSRSLFEHALRVTERNHVAHINLGLALARAGRLEEAEENLTAAIAIAPASAKARGLRGEVRAARGKHPRAGADFRAALRLEPGSARWEVGLGRVLLKAERLEGAEAAFRRALASEPERADTHALLAAVLGARGEVEAGLGHLAEAIRLEPERAELHASRAALLEGLGREAEAVAAYREALRLGERSARALNNLAWLLAVTSDPALRSPAEAARLAEEAVALTQGAEPSVLDTLAVAYAAAGRTDEARATAERALALAEAQNRRALARTIRQRLLDRGDLPSP